MRGKVKLLCHILIIITFAFINANQSFGQKKMILSAGIGFPDLLNIGIRYQILDQAKIGLSIGWWPPSSSSGIIIWGNLISFSGDFYYHFGGSSKFSDMRPWYGRIGLNNITNYHPTSYLRIGRDLNSDKNFVISIDAGLGFQSVNKEIYPIPTLGLCSFYRF
jgi:hypothetical protein